MAIYELLRVREWLDSKVSLYLFSIVFIFNCAQSCNKNNFWCCWLFLLYYISFIGASYLVNDISDIEVDKAVEKKKIISEFPKAAVYFILSAVMITGTLPMVLYIRSWLCFAAAIAIYLLGFAYSLKPFRFKEKGLVGTIFCSVVQRCAPVGLAFFVCKTDMIVFSAVILLNFFVGMRYIFIHQLIDRKNDEISGVNTFSRSHTIAAKSFIYVNIICEAMVMILTCLYLFRIGMKTESLTAAAVIIVYAVLVFIYVRALRFMLNENVFETYSFVPLEDLYSVTLPVIICAANALTQPLWIINTLFVLVIQFRMIKVRTGFLAKYFITILKIGK